ncbi:MAG: hypothetical protein COA82_03470 [Alkaliphilus sp.]|nr:MAG: hypothetical protein COA82_03470 [Alkaliphilus sp.]
MEHMYYLFLFQHTRETNYVINRLVFLEKAGIVHNLVHRNAGLGTPICIIFYAQDTDDNAEIVKLVNNVLEEKLHVIDSFHSLRRCEVCEQNVLNPCDLYDRDAIHCARTEVFVQEDKEFTYTFDRRMDSIKIVPKDKDHWNMKLVKHRFLTPN